MTLIFNIMLPLIILIIAFIGYRASKKSENKYVTFGKTFASMVFAVVVYGNIQPSYLPKGEAPQLSRIPIEQVEIEVSDRLMKPVSKEDRQKRVDELLTAKDEIKQIIEKKDN